VDCGWKGSSATNYRIAFVIIVVYLVVSGVNGCAPSTQHQTSVAVSPTPTPYLGIDKMEKVYIPSIQKKALVVVLLAEPNGGDSEARAQNVFNALASSLEQSDLDIAIIKVPIVQGVVYSNGVMVYAHDKKGHWGPSNDKSLLNAIIRAGL
jgi:hypothetical protein